MTSSNTTPAGPSASARRPAELQLSVDRKWQPVSRRLITMRRTARQLDEIGTVTVVLMEDNPAVGLVVERMLWLLADQAAEINALVVPTLTGRAALTPAESFEAVIKAGMISADLAPILAPSEGPHNVLMQLCMDTAPGEVAPIVSQAVSGYKEYVDQVALWIAGNA